MESISVCPECGAVWSEGRRCRDVFDQALAWEFEDAAGAGAVHHLTVLCYYLQHPSLYSPEGLRQARQLLREFVEEGASPQSVRRQNRQAFSSERRQWRFRGSPASYARRPPWTMTILDAAAGGPTAWCDRVQAWAHSVNEALKTVPTGNG